MKEKKITDTNPKIITVGFLADYFKIDLAEAKLVFKKLERLEYNNNDLIIEINTTAEDGMYFIEEGQATVYNSQGEEVNEMSEGQHFGEYAILTNETRLTSVRAHGKVVAYRISSKDFLKIVSKHPAITGQLLKQVYDQITVKHTKLTSLTKRHRGVMWSPDSKKDSRLSSILLTYGVTIAVFLVVFIITPYVDSHSPLWQLFPLIFLMGFTLRTKRILEGLLLTVMLLGGMLYEGNFVKGFGQMLINGVGNTSTSETIIIMGMVEAVAALLAASGVINAFKKIAQKKATTKRKSLFLMLLIMILVCVDECLNVLTAGYCLNEVSDQNKIPRESRALLGSFSMAICALIPFSLWSAYICGWANMYLNNGGSIFLQSIPYNLAGVIAFILAILVCLCVLPKTKQLKEAYRRVEAGGKLWPSGSERYFDTDYSDNVVGRPINLILPMIVWALSSVVCGIINNSGEFALDAVSGLIITLIFMFLLYVGQKLMTPKMFFETFANGIGNALMPILLLVLSERIAGSLGELGLNETLLNAIPKLVAGNLFLLPMLIFVLCTLICLGLGSCWGMYGIGIPMAIMLASGLEINVPLCFGAALAAGIVGEALCPYLDDSSPVVRSIGCNPVAYRSLRRSYWLFIALLAVLGYIVLGAVC